MDKDQIAYIARLFLDEFSVNVELGELTFKHVRYLMRVAEAEEQGQLVRAHDLSQELGLEPSNASRLIADLSGHSKRLPEPLLRVQIDASNRRHRLLSLTPTAKRLRSRNKSKFAKIVNGILKDPGAPPTLT